MRLARSALWAAIALSFGAPALAQPSGLTAIHGAATVTQAGNVTTVTTHNGDGTRHSALDWRSFGVPGGSTVFFAQPDALSTSINRVLGGNPSTIAGTLGSNGRLVLVNPAGIAVAPGAVVDTAGFTAATLGMSKTDAIAGRLRFSAGDTGDFVRKDGDDDKRVASSGPLQVQGRVLARNGDVVLIGPDLSTGSGAVLQASGGDVVLAAGRSVELTGPGLEGIHLQLRAPDDRAVNLGTLRGDSVGIFAGQLHHSGVIQARSVSTSGGKVVLQASGDGEIEGVILASNAARGGSVLLSAGKLTLKPATFIDVSHPAGGGEILVGGGLEGRDPRLPNASEVDVEKGVVLRADAAPFAGEAARTANGGTVVVWSESETHFAGAIFARGSAGGSGGLVEVSSRGRIRYEGSVDVLGDGAAGAPAARPDSEGSGSSGGSGSSDGGSRGSSGGSGDSGGSGGSGGSGSSGSSGSSGNSGSSGSSGGPGPSGDSGRSGDSGSGSSGSSSSGRAPLPQIPLIGQASEVRSAAEQPASTTAAFLSTSTKVLDPNVDEFAAMLQPASTGTESDARAVRGGAAERERRRGELTMTGTQCRTGS